MTSLFAALDATWPAVATHRAGGWLVREGRGGGKRVSSAVVAAADAAATIAAAEATHATIGQPPLFCLRPDESPTEADADLALAGLGYRIADPVLLFTAPVARIAAEPPARMTTFPIWPPLAITAELWAEGGIGPERLQVMERAPGPKTAILGREADRAAGAAFAALCGDIAMIHALHVAPDQRRRGLGRNLMRAAAAWAAEAGAAQIALAVTEANAPACTLYRALGMTVAARYHYRTR